MISGARSYAAFPFRHSTITKAAQGTSAYSTVLTKNPGLPGNFSRKVKSSPIAIARNLSRSVFCQIPISAAASDAKSASLRRSITNVAVAKSQPTIT